MAKIKINIYDNEFEVSAPYAEGHTLSEIEANVLNRVRAENISNNQRAHVKAAIDGKDGAKSLDEVKADFAAYDKAYVFNMVAARGSRTSMTPLERECTRIAKAWLVQKLRESSTTLKAYTEANGKEAVDAKVAEVAGNDQIVKMAKANLKRAENEPELEVAL